jgi:DNA-directed RNA polymerase specialized sigma24 family protein
LFEVAWRAADRYDAERGSVTFATFLYATAQRRIVDYLRSSRGRTRWQFAGHTYERERPQVVSLDELDSVGESHSRGAGDSATDCASSLGGLLADGSGQTSRDLRLIRRLVA